MAEDISPIISWFYSKFNIHEEKAICHLLGTTHITNAIRKVLTDYKYYGLEDISDFAHKWAGDQASLITSYQKLVEYIYKFPSVAFAWADEAIEEYGWPSEKHAFDVMVRGIYKLLHDFAITVLEKYKEIQK